VIGDDEGMECDGLWDGEAWNIAEVEVVGIVGVGEVGDDLERFWIVGETFKVARSGWRWLSG
jgi:hypothetical protein